MLFCFLGLSIIYTNTNSSRPWIITHCIVYLETRQSVHCILAFNHHPQLVYSKQIKSQSREISSYDYLSDVTLSPININDSVMTRSFSVNNHNTLRFDQDRLEPLVLWFVLLWALLI